ncbi:Uu.00g058950.m01.CDS01 [Anthostomella pinea]|uniref:Uu.00g058950.m01.CDS01 n=1 Tax=Anthostomella pinea TaxID=933095 RepID=A0AAI8YMF6_9PEZI|nr:Uu.00g058950.m01.CDS01 [Anthostomella pinea]
MPHRLTPPPVSTSARGDGDEIILGSIREDRENDGNGRAAPAGGRPDEESGHPVSATFENSPPHEDFDTDSSSDTESLDPDGPVYDDDESDDEDLYLEYLKFENPGPLADGAADGARTADKGTSTRLDYESSTRPATRTNAPGRLEAGYSGLDDDSTARAASSHSREEEGEAGPSAPQPTQYPRLDRDDWNEIGSDSAGYTSQSSSTSSSSSSSSSSPSSSPLASTTTATEGVAADEAPGEKQDSQSQIQQAQRAARRAERARNRAQRHLDKARRRL